MIDGQLRLKVWTDAALNDSGHCQVSFNRMPRGVLHALGGRGRS